VLVAWVSVRGSLSAEFRQQRADETMFFMRGYDAAVMSP